MYSRFKTPSRLKTSVVDKDFQQRVKATPTKPGVYLMLDNSGLVLYIGKASNLKHRLRSYFGNHTTLDPKIQRMVSKIADFEFILTESEQEALILESNLIKQHKPTYNARLKDDKSYPFIKIDVSEEFPQVYITRRPPNDGSRYFGPFASAQSVRRTLHLLKKLFPYRSCTKQITGTDSRPCLDFYINRCIGPCTGAATKQEYKEVIHQVTLFLEGKTDQVVKNLKERMGVAAESLEFEKASSLRDQIQAIERVNEGQKVMHLNSENLDVIGLAPSREETWIEVFFVRQGKLIGRDHFTMTKTEEDQPNKTLSAFVKQFYGSNPYVPPTILLQHPLEDESTIQQWLCEKRKGTVKLHTPHRGEKKRLVKMVAENAAEGLHQQKVRASQKRGRNEGVSQLQEALSLPRMPNRIECYDISNIQGTNPVGSMVVIENGKSKTSDYRKFKIKTVDGINDYSMMQEVLNRRLKHLIKVERCNPTSGKHPKDQSWSTIPDLILIDGGKGHLGAALQTLLELGLTSIPLASVAKEKEEIFVPEIPEPVILPRNSQALFLIQLARDEAHRFAITFHRQRRSKRSLSSALDTISGIGPQRRKKLLRQFGSIKGIREATVTDIAAVDGLTITTANRIKTHLLQLTI